MAADLGTWTPDQAQVLLDVLQRAGLSPEARRTRDGVQVSVDDSESDLAHATLVANMDAIAQAARPPTDIRDRRARQKKGRSRPAPRDKPQAPLGSERMTRWAPVIGILVLGMMISLVAPALRFPVAIATVLGIVYILGKRTGPHDER